MKPIEKLLKTAKVEAGEKLETRVTKVFLYHENYFSIDQSRDIYLNYHEYESGQQTCGSKEKFRREETRK